MQSHQPSSAEARGKMPGRRRAAFGLGAAAALGLGTLWVASKGRMPWESRTSRPSDEALPTYRVLNWDDLMPKEWDPTRRLRKPDGSLLSDLDPRAQKMLQDLRAIWDNAPTVSALDGTFVKLPGYVVPLDAVDGALTEFLLVPYFGACIHTPPPPANQIVHVMPEKPVSGFGAMSTVWVSGRMSTRRQDSPMGASGYRLDSRVVETYRPPPS